jgi:hypothetical protein
VDEARAVRVPMWVQDLLQDLSYGLRQVRRNPGFTASALLVLALGIGANAAIFSLLDAVMLRTLPVEDPNRLAEIMELYPGAPRLIAYFQWSDYEHVRDANHVLSDLIGVSFAPFGVGDGSSSTQNVQGAYVSGNYFSSLGLQPAVGRFIGPRDEATGATACFHRIACLPLPGSSPSTQESPTTVRQQAAVSSALDTSSRPCVITPGSTHASTRCTTHRTATAGFGRQKRTLDMGHRTLDKEWTPGSGPRTARTDSEPRTRDSGLEEPLSC